MCYICIKMKAQYVFVSYMFVGLSVFVYRQDVSIRSSCVFFVCEYMYVCVRECVLGVYGSPLLPGCQASTIWAAC